MSQTILQAGYAENIRKAANDVALHKVVSDLVAAKKGLNHGKKRLGKKSNIYQHAIDLLQATGVVISKDALQQRVARALKAECKPHEVEQVRFSIPSSETEMSSLTTPDIVNSPLTGNLHGDGTPSLYQLADNLPQLESGSGGRRKGSTKAQKQKDIAKELLCIESISKEYEREFSSVKSNGRRVKKGFLKRLIDEKKKEFSVKQSIPKHIIHTHVYRGTLSSKHRGLKSLLEEVETALVQICIQMGKF